MGAPRGRLARIVTEYEAGRPVMFALPACDGCGYETRVKVKSRDNAPDELIANVLRRRDWEVIGQKLRCPACASRRGRASAAAALAAFTRQTQEKPMTAPSPPPLTPESRKRIREALYEHYDEDHGRYRQSWSDKGLGAKLNVPWKWVEEIRVALGFGPDENEASALQNEEVRAIKTELLQISDDFMTRFSALEARMKKIEIDTAYKAA